MGLRHFASWAETLGFANEISGSEANARWFFSNPEISFSNSRTLWFTAPNGLTPRSVSDADGNAAQTYYDALGRPILTVDALGNATSMTYLWSWQPQSVEKVGVHASFFALAA
jgi:YD repeat-containing protein